MTTGGIAPAEEIRTTDGSSIPAHPRFISLDVIARGIAPRAARRSMAVTTAMRAPTARAIIYGAPEKLGAASAMFRSSTVPTAPVLIRRILVRTTERGAGRVTSGAETIAPAIHRDGLVRDSIREARSATTRAGIGRHTIREASDLTPTTGDGTAEVINVPDGTTAKVRTDVSIRTRTLLCHLRLGTRIGAHGWTIVLATKRRRAARKRS